MKKRHKFYTSIFLIFILFLLLTDKTNFPRAMYDLLTISYEDRMLKRHDYCGNTGYGYIKFLQKKFDLKDINPLIYNFRSASPKYWLFKDITKKNNDNYVIVLNMDESEKQLFKKNGDEFKSEIELFDLSFIEKIEFIFKNNEKIESFSGNIIFFNKVDKKNTEILDIEFKDIFLTNNSFITNIENEKLKRMRKNSLSKDVGELIIKIKSDNIYYENNLKELYVSFKKNFKFRNYQILNNYQKCYFLKKNV